MSLRRRGKNFILGIVGVAALMVASWAFAIHFGVSQFFGIKRSRTAHAAKVFNPTTNEMFGVAISYETDETFDTCEGFLLTPHGSVELSTSGFSSEKGHLEIISMPTKKGRTPPINHLYGLRGRTKKTTSDFQVDGLLFSFEGGAVAGCVCDELDNFNLPSTLFHNMKINC